MQTLDPENQARLIEWAAANFNTLREMFTEPLELDYEAIRDHAVEQAEAAKQQQTAGGMPGAPGAEGPDDGTQAALGGEDGAAAPDAPPLPEAAQGAPQAAEREAA